MLQSTALSILKTGANVFITGSPGAGKTYVVNEYITYLKQHGIFPTVTASTGIAATHVQGITLHSFAGLGPFTSADANFVHNLKPPTIKRIEKTNVLIIDEISMLHAETLNSVNAICKYVKKNDKPFGGIQVVLVGDFFQLPPITKEGDTIEYAFTSYAWKELNLATCYITEQHRQKEDALLMLLEAIRKGAVEDRHISILNKSISDIYDEDNKSPKLFTHNTHVDRLNKQQLDSLDTKSTTFTMQTYGSPNYIETLKKGCLSPEQLELKKGALVMCTKNIPQLNVVNGTIGTVLDWEDQKSVTIRTIDNREKTLEMIDWSVEIEGKVRASIVQIPLRLAWAITIHKSQGMTLDSATIDLRSTFEYGQGYVALSRVRNIKGIQLIGYNEKALQVNPDIIEKDAYFITESKRAEDLTTKRNMEELATDFILKKGGSFSYKPKEELGDTYEQTKQLILQKLPISEIAKRRDVTIGTIASHVQELVHTKRLAIQDVEYLMSSTIANNLPKLRASIVKHGAEKLKPHYDELNGALSYDELKLAMLFV